MGVGEAQSAGLPLLWFNENVWYNACGVLAELSSHRPGGNPYVGSHSSPAHGRNVTSSTGAEFMGGRKGASAVD
jgi:hypothetical protein